MKVVLLNPYFSGISTVPSLGLGFLAYFIKLNLKDVEVQIIEPQLQRKLKDDVLKTLDNTDFLGMVVYTENRFQVFAFAKEAKERNNNLKIVLGGPHVYSLSKLILKYYPFIDYIVRGDGEEPLSKLLSGENLDRINGLTYRNQDEIKETQISTVLPDFNSLRYDYNSCYIKDWKDPEVPPYLLKLNHLPFISSRGCIFNCSFCATSRLCNYKWRGYSPKVLVKIMEELVSKFNIKYFRIYDALFMPYKNYLQDFFKEIKERNLDIHYRIDTHVNVHEQYFPELRKSGCDVLGYGIESGSDRILKLINKNITREQVLRSIKLAKKNGFWIIGYFMRFHPTETEEDVLLTEDLMKRFDLINLQYFKIHPDTPFYDQLKSKSEITDETWFDPSFGITSRYGNEAYYCKELFKSSKHTGRGVVF